MELTIFDVIKKPVMSNKSLELFKKLGKITFEVNKLANKIVIREAVEKAWNVKVAGVRIITVPGKAKSFGRKVYNTPSKKKAIVTLKKGYKIDIPGMFESMGTGGAGEKIETEREPA
jgi:large subunit ribosomal protein L23